MSGPAADIALRRKLVLGLIASGVTGMSVTSRVLTLLLLVPAARMLSFADFGTFSVILGVAVAVANVVGSAPSDLIATATKHRLARTRRGVFLAVTGCTIASTVLALVSTVVPEPHRTMLLTTALCATATAPVLAMSLLRGIGRPLLGAALPYIVLPLGRCVALGGAGASGTSAVGHLLMWLAAVGIGTGVLTIVTVVCARPAGGWDTGGHVRAVRLWPALGAGALISATWLLLGQTGPLALTHFLGPSAAAALVPTLRLCDSTTALGIGFKAAASRQLQSSDDGRFPPGTVKMLLSAFAASAGAMCAVAPWAVPALFGVEYRFLWTPAVLLLGASAFSVLLAAKIQLLFGIADYRRLAVGTTAAVVAAIVGNLLGAAWAGPDGVATATLLTTATWFTALSVRTGPARPM